MAVRVTGTDGDTLLRHIHKAIKDKVIDTWDLDNDGDLTHSPPQWRNKAWFRPKTKENGLTFFILTPRGQTLSRSLYGLYHGRLIEMLLNHFDAEFQSVAATAYAVPGDIIRPSA